jgi:hypothetical protein
MQRHLVARRSTFALRALRTLLACALAACAEGAALTATPGNDAQTSAGADADHSADSSNGGGAGAAGAGGSATGGSGAGGADAAGTAGADGSTTSISDARSIDSAATESSVVEAGSESGVLADSGARVDGSHGDAAAPIDATIPPRDAGPDAIVANDGGVVVDGPEAYWRFDEGSGTTAADATGHGHTMTLTGAQWTTGRVGTSALSLDGNTQFAQAAGAVVDTSRPYSVTAWLQMSQVAGYRTAVAIEGVMVSAFFLQFRDENPRTLSFAALPADAVAAASAVARATATPVAGIWYHVGAVFDGANMKLYVNGVLQQSVPFATAWAGTGNTVIGRSRYAGGNADFWPGFIDDVRIFSRALSDAEVATLAQ